MAICEPSKIAEWCPVWTDSVVWITFDRLMKEELVWKKRKEKRYYPFKKKKVVVLSQSITLFNELWKSKRNSQYGKRTEVRTAFVTTDLCCHNRLGSALQQNYWNIFIPESYFLPIARLIISWPNSLGLKMVAETRFSRMHNKASSMLYPGKASHFDSGHGQNSHSLTDHLLSLYSWHSIVTWNL